MPTASTISNESNTTMINFNLTIRWPSKYNFSNRSILAYKKTVSKNKDIAFNVNNRGWKELFCIYLDFAPIGQSYGGLHVILGLFGLEVELEFYDTRRWNYDARRWCTPEEEDEW